MHLKGWLASAASGSSHRSAPQRASTEPAANAESCAGVRPAGLLPIWSATSGARTPSLFSDFHRFCICLLSSQVVPWPRTMPLAFCLMQKTLKQSQFAEPLVRLRAGILGGRFSPEHSEQGRRREGEGGEAPVTVSAQLHASEVPESAFMRIALPLLSACLGKRHAPAADPCAKHFQSCLGTYCRPPCQANHSDKPLAPTKPRSVTTS